MNQSFSSESMEKIPYITSPPRDGRALILLPFFDHEKQEWHKPILDNAGKLIILPVIDLAEGLYLSSAAADSANDYYSFLATFVFQHLSFKSVATRYLALEKTVHYFAACLESYHRITSSVNKNDSLLVEAELGYVLILIRRFYDLIQKIMVAASALVKDVNSPSRPLINPLPESFSDMVKKDKNIRSSDEIAEKWKLPKQIADLYFIESRHFLLIRDIRVGLEHHGKGLGILFNHQDGYAVLTSSEPWKRLAIWNESNTRPNELGSARAIIAHLISEALDLGSRFVKAYWSCIGTPKAIAGENKCYLRNPYSHWLNSLNLMISQPWERYIKEPGHDNAT